jgi:predicted nucleotidyltransferase component of viral defense system
MIAPPILGQVRLLMQLLPDVFKQKGFFLKGGTAINFFIRDVPRLSVDIDLVYGLIADRTESLSAISRGMEKIAQSIGVHFPSSRIEKKRIGGHIATLLVNDGTSMVKIETNTILRGSVFPGQERPISRALSERFSMDFYVTANTLSPADVYGGKICAALDRQHPRDFFDIKILFENEGLTDDIRKAFVVYLAGHDRPMAELLEPNKSDIRRIFETEFLGMTDIAVAYKDLERVRERLVSTIRKDLTNDERRFLISIKSGEPQWNLLGIKGIETLPALQWKLLNIGKMPRAKHKKALEKLMKILM